MTAIPRQHADRYTLHLRGALIDAPRIGLVGSRPGRIHGPLGDTYLATTYEAARTLADHGCSIWSGLALGADSAAHTGALDALGHTVAVVGHGLSVHPPHERALEQRILAGGGAVLSPFDDALSPRPWTFPARDRLLAHCVDALLVCGMTETGGTRITFDAALAAHVPVFFHAALARQEWACQTLVRPGHVRVTEDYGAVLVAARESYAAALAAV